MPTHARSAAARGVLARHGCIAAVAVLVLGSALAGWSAVRMVEGERTAAAADLQDVAADVGRALEVGMAEKVAALHGVAQVIAAAGPARDVAAFDAAAEAALARDPSLPAIGMARAVDDVVVHEASRADGLEVRPTRSGPAVFLERIASPDPVNQGAVGFDLASEPRRRAAVEAAVAGATSAGSAPVALVPPRPGGLASVVFVPSFAGGRAPGTVEGRWAAFVGGVAAVLSPDEVLADQELGELRVQVVDLGAVAGLGGQEPVLMAATGGPTATTADDALRGRVELEVEGRRWEVAVDGPAPGVGGALSIAALEALVVVLAAALLWTGAGAARRLERANAALERQQQERRAVLAAVGDGYLRVDDGLTVRAAEGEGWEEHRGGTLGGVLGAPDEALVLLDLVRDVLADGVARTSDLQVRGSDGDPDRVFEVRAVPLDDEVAVLLRDVSRRARMERELRAAHASIQQFAASLEDRVLARTFQLQELTEELERINLEMERFVYEAAHELRTPLSVVYGSLAWVAEHGRLAEREADLVGRARQACDRMRVRLDILVDEAHRIAAGEVAGPTAPDVPAPVPSGQHAGA